MSVTTDIVATWRRPRQTMRRLLAMGEREDRAIAILFGACFLIFLSQLPVLSRKHALLEAERLATNAKASDQVVTLQAEMAITFFAWMLIWPLLLYGIGGLSRLAARVLGGRGSAYGARLALFWSLLASTPVWLFYGVVRGFIGPGLEQQVVGLLVVASFLSFWGICLRESETNPEGASVP